MVRHEYPHLCRRCGRQIPRTGWLSEVHRICAVCFDVARQSAPPIACTAEAIDAGMFHMEHGHYPTGEEPA